MNKKTIDLAARLYLLANTAHLDHGGLDNEQQYEVLQAAVEKARARLDLLGYHWPSLNTLQACIDAAKARNQ